MDLRRLAAVHESGHLLASFGSKLPQAKGASIKPDATTAGRIFWGVPLDRRTLPRDLLESAAVVFLAGLAAEERAVGGDPQPLEAHGAGDDVARAAELLEAHKITGEAASALLSRAWARARDLVASRWAHVEWIAEALERVETLDAAGVTRLRAEVLALAEGERRAAAKISRIVREVISEARAHDAVERARKVPAAARRRA